MDTVLETRRTDESTIVIVANRGPHDFVRQEGCWVAKASCGGLVSMIGPLARQPNVAWFCCVSEPPGSETGRDALFTTAKDQTDPDLNVVPVPVPADVYQAYYGEISNEVLWMLQHHLVGQFGYSALDEKRHRAWHEGYLEANRLMAEGIAATEIPVRAFLIQDYHLYPLSRLLRESFPQTPSLHFIHIPFPEPAMLKLVPKAWREEILRGLLGADVVGLQTEADARSFLACCEQLLGATVDHQRRTVIQPGHNVRVRTFPAGINAEEVLAVRSSSDVAAARERLAAEARECNVIRVDRLDPSKNQVLGFAAFGRLLELQPELQGRVRFLAFLIPSRTDVTVYREYHDAVFAEIERVNAQFAAACGGEPIRVFYTNDRAQAFAAMESCDVLLVNSRADGMNLVVKEWAVLSQKPGVLVVSETAGVAPEANGGALLVCPLDVEGTAQALSEALRMSTSDRGNLLERLRASLGRWTARDWLSAQLEELGLKFTIKAVPLHRAPAGIEGGVIERELTVRNRSGLHARPAAAFVRRAREFAGTVEIVKGEETFSAQSIFGVLSANLNHGAQFTLRASGNGAEETINALSELLVKFEREEG